MRIKLFTHTDLDGIGCAILGKLAFKNIDIEHCNYDDINEKVKSFIENQVYKDFDFVYITDISVNEEIADLIHNTHPDNFREGFNLGEMFQLLDHHKTAEWLNRYWWAVVEESESETHKNSGTSLFYNSLIDDEYLHNFKGITDFVEVVRKYDTWEWQTKYNDGTPKLYNDLFRIIGREKFIEKVYDDLTNGIQETGFSPSDLCVLEIEQNRINHYVESKEKKMIIKDINDYHVGIIFAEQYQSELGNVLSTNHHELDFIIIIDLSSSISYRGIKDSIDLGQFAKIYGGGGHPKAAGSQISEDIRNNIIEMIFK